MTNTTKVAEALHSYVKFRAHQEGIGYNLDVPFFRKALDQGCEVFFGVQIGEDGLEYDDQNPGAFAVWMREFGQPVHT